MEQSKQLQRWGLLLANIVMAVVVMFPIIYAMCVTFKPASEVYAANFLPLNPTLKNISDAFATAPLGTYLVNTFIVATAITISQSITSCWAAFAFRFLTFKGKGILFSLVMATMMVPGESIIIAQYLMVRDWGWLDTLYVLIVPFTISTIGIFLFKQALENFPYEIYESARMDGCSNIYFVFHILMPLMRPTMGALAVSSFLSGWNMYMWPLLTTSANDSRTVQIGLSMLNAVDSQSVVLIIAGVVSCMVPSLAIFVVSQKNMVKGLTAGAVKG